MANYLALQAGGNLLLQAGGKLLLQLQPPPPPPSPPAIGPGGAIRGFLGVGRGNMLSEKRLTTIAREAEKKLFEQEEDDEEALAWLLSEL